LKLYTETQGLIAKRQWVAAEFGDDTRGWAILQPNGRSIMLVERV